MWGRERTREREREKGKLKETRGKRYGDKKKLLQKKYIETNGEKVREKDEDTSVW